MIYNSTYIYFRKLARFYTYPLLDTNINLIYLNKKYKLLRLYFF